MNTRLLFSLEIILITLSVNVSHPTCLWEPGNFLLTESIEFKRSTPCLDQSDKSLFVLSQAG